YPRVLQWNVSASGISRLGDVHAGTRRFWRELPKSWRALSWTSNVSLTVRPITFTKAAFFMSREATEMTVEAVTLEVPDSKTIKLKWPEGHDVHFKTGQFITCYWPDEPSYKRAYSLSSCALDRGFYEFTVKRDGKMGTRIVDWAKPGDRMVVIPPTGRFLPEFDKHLICIAGGSGVT